MTGRGDRWEVHGGGHAAPRVDDAHVLILVPSRHGEDAWFGGCRCGEWQSITGADTDTVRGWWADHVRFDETGSTVPRPIGSA